jgi:hypothetical protein
MPPASMSGKLETLSETGLACHDIYSDTESGKKEKRLSMILDSSIQILLDRLVRARDDSWKAATLRECPVFPRYDVQK